MAGTPEHPTRRIDWVLTAAILGTAMTIIDVTAMNVVAPTIQTDLGTDVTGIQWILNGYTLFFASLMLLGGALADRFGRVRAYSAGVLLFGVASVGCAVAPNAPALVAARAFQGMGAALMVPGALALIGASYERAERGRALGRWSGTSAMMAVLGPVLGGILADVASWRWIFIVNVPIVIALLLILRTRVPEPAPTDPSTGAFRPLPMDPAGAVLITAALAAMTYAIITSTISGWRAPIVLVPAALGAVLLLGFLLHEHRTKHPMVPLALFRDRGFSIVNVQTLLVYGALAAGMLFLPLRLIQLEGYAPTHAGLAVMPVALIIGLASPAIGRAIDRIGDRVPLGVGSLLVAAGMAWLASAPHDANTSGSLAGYVHLFMPGILLIGSGMAGVAAPSAHRVLASVPANRIGVGSAVNNAVSRLAALLAISIMGVLAVAVFGHGLAADLAGDDGLDESTRDAIWAERFDLGAAEPPAHLAADAAARVQAWFDDAFMAAYRAVYLMVAGFAAVSAVLALSLPRPSSREATAEA